MKTCEQKRHSEQYKNARDVELEINLNMHANNELNAGITKMFTFFKRILCSQQQRQSSAERDSIKWINLFEFMNIGLWTLSCNSRSWPQSQRTFPSIPWKSNLWWPMPRGLTFYEFWIGNCQNCRRSPHIIYFHAGRRRPYVLRLCESIWNARHMT